MINATNVTVTMATTTVELMNSQTRADCYHYVYHRCYFDVYYDGLIKDSAKHSSKSGPSYFP